MNFRYIGDDNDPPQQTVFMGVKFRLGELSDVTDPLALKKISASRLFEKVGPTPNVVAHVSVGDSHVATLEAAGVKVDGRWGDARLALEVQALGSH